MNSTLEAILKLEVPIIVRLAERTMTLSEVMEIVSGSIIELRKSSESELDLMVNNKVIGSGGAMKVGENFGIRITFIGDLAQRIEALGGGSQTAPEREKEMTDDELAEAMLAGQV